MCQDTSRCKAASHQEIACLRKISEAIAVTQKMDDTSLLEKMRYMSKDADTCKGQEDDIEAFRNLKTLKEDADKIDTNLIYAMNCGVINSGPTYVFKTSWYTLETAVKMDATCKQYIKKLAYCHSRKRSLMGCTVNVKAIKHLHCGHTIKECDA